MEDAIELSGYSLTANSDFERPGARRMGRRNGKVSSGNGKRERGRAAVKGGEGKGRPGDSTCLACGAMVFSSRNACFSCSVRKGQGNQEKGGEGAKGEIRKGVVEEKKAEPLHLGETTEAWLGKYSHLHYTPVTSISLDSLGL